VDRKILNMKKFSKPVKFIIGIFLLPMTVFIFLAVAEVLWSLLKNYKTTSYLFIGGALYLFIYKFIYGFSRLYVMAHEAAHALIALICGHKVQSVEIGKDSGNVKLSGVNVFILLAPYVLPVMVFFVVLIYFAFALFSVPADKRIFIFLFGFFTAHHLTHTYKTLTETEQSDIKMAGGSIFSFPLIVLFNTIVILLLLEAFFPGMVSIWQLIKSALIGTVEFWINAAKYFYNFINWAARR
jgi:hypothetical protein